MSGYPQVLFKNRRPGATAFLAKPFNARDLRSAIRPFVQIPDTGILNAESRVV